jgi:hypothetical protein
LNPGASVPDEVAADAIVDDVLAEVQLGKTRRESTSQFHNLSSAEFCQAINGHWTPLFESWNYLISLNSSAISSMIRHIPMHDFLLPKSRSMLVQYSWAKYQFSTVHPLYFVLRAIPVAALVCAMNIFVQHHLGEKDTLVMIAFSSMLGLN